jgi:ubiquinone/menaquinone biosynthesis C-methylase UbiE
MKKLNLGCGLDIKEGFVNLDSKKLPGVDVVHNIECAPLPFNDEEFDYILCQDVLEHVEYIDVLKELHRILKKGGIVEIRAPHFSSVNNFRDPTHKKMFSVFVFEMFVKSTQNIRHYYFDFHFEKCISKKITFRENFFYWPIKKFSNLNNSILNFFEYSFLSRVFPADNIVVSLLK